MSVSRRTFLQATGALGAMAGMRSILPAYAGGWTNDALRGVPAAAARASSDGVMELRIQESAFAIGNRRGVATTINDTVPGPLLRFREGEDYLLRVTNGLDEDTSIHWHGLIVPNAMDGVPDVNFPGIRPGETYDYRLPIRQNGTYWYHSHSGLQEQTGQYGPIIIDPKDPEPFSYDREYVIVLSDWTFENPYKVLDRLKKQSSYYNFQRRTVGELFRDFKRRGIKETVSERLQWGRMRMSPTDIADVTGATYTYLLNGLAPDANWTGLVRPGERVRLRFINASAGTFFDVRIPGLEMTVVAVSGQNVQPVVTDEIRMEIAQTYDVIIQPTEAHAYTIFAESMDRSGFARGTIAPSAGMEASIPRRRPRPTLTMADMGMAMGSMEGMSGMAGMAGMAAHDMKAAGHEPASDAKTDGMRAPGTVPEEVTHGPDSHGPGNATTPMSTQSRLHEPGVGLGDDGWRVLRYSELRSLRPLPDFRAPEREVEVHLTGTMERYMWSIDGVKYSDVKEPIRFSLGERVRLTMVNDTMMSHPMHLHGMWMELENGAGAECPRIHTIGVKPAERVSVLITPRDLGPWAFHCHVLFHMEMGMFRVVEVTERETPAVPDPRGAA